MTAGDRRRIDRVLAWLVAGQLVGIVALVIAILGLVGETGSRRDSARDSCRLIRGLALTATTGASSAAATVAYINQTPLRDCDLYARKLVR